MRARRSERAHAIHRFGRTVFCSLVASASISLGAPTSLSKTVGISNNADVAFGPAGSALPKGTTLSVLAGDRSKPGPFVLRVIAPPNTMILPHVHHTAETLTIISGSVYQSIGKIAVRSTGKRVETGGFVYLPPYVPHYVWTTGKAAVLQVNGSGPFAVDYIKKST